MKKLLLFAYALAVGYKGMAQSYTQVPVTGFNADVVANGTGHSNLSSNFPIDAVSGGYTFVASGFVNSLGQSPATFLPANGIINSAATPGLTFQLAPYSGNNSLRVVGGSTGTLTLTTPKAVNQLCILATTGYASTSTITVNFSDATTQVFTGQSLPNWYGGSGFAIKGISRVNRTIDVIENNTEDPRIYQFLLNISAANTGKTVQSIIFANTTANSYLHVMGVSAQVTLAKDVAVTAITGANSGCGLTTQENVCVTIKNSGSAAQSNFPVSYKVNGGTPVTETFAGPIAAGATANYCFTAKANLSAAGNYSIEACAGLTNDEAPANDCTTKVVTTIPTVTTFPYFQDFETNDGGWVTSGTNSSWAFGTPAKAKIKGAASGTKAFVTSLTGSYNNSENSVVLGPCFNFSPLTNPQIDLKVWCNAEFSMDGAVLQSSSDNGVTWNNVGFSGDPNNWFNDASIDAGPGGQAAATAEGWTATSSNGWVRVRHALTGLGGQSNVKLRIAFASNASTVYDGFAFDDVLIYEKPTTDALVTSIASFSTGCVVGLDPVTIQVENAGTTAINNLVVKFQLTPQFAAPPAAVTDTIPGTIAPGATQSFTFNPGKLNLSNGGIYTVTASTMLTGDQVPQNDATSVKHETIPYITTYPYSQNFENGDGGWKASGTNSSWAFGTPAKAKIKGAASGVNAWVTSLTGNYNGSEKSQVTAML